MNDFKVGDLVFHLRCGLCEIKDISPLKGNEGGPTYYILSPLYGDERGTLVFVPTAKPIFLRELMSKEEIDGGLIGGASLKAEDFSKVVNY